MHLTQFKSQCLNYFYSLFNSTLNFQIMSKLNYASILQSSFFPPHSLEIRAGPKRSEYSEEDFQTPNAHNTDSVPKIEISAAPFNLPHQPKQYNNDFDKENKDTANLPPKAEKTPKSDYVSSFLKGAHITTTFTNDIANDYQNNMKSVRNGCPSPHFNGGWTSSRNLGNPQKGFFTQDRYLLEPKVEPVDEGTIRKAQGNRNVNKTPLHNRQNYEEKGHEGGNMRRSISAEDLRMAKKVFETEANKNPPLDPKQGII